MPQDNPKSITVSDAIRIAVETAAIIEKQLKVDEAIWERFCRKIVEKCSDDQTLSADTRQRLKNLLDNWEAFWRGRIER